MHSHPRPRRAGSQVDPAVPRRTPPYGDPDPDPDPDAWAPSVLATASANSVYALAASSWNGIARYVTLPVGSITYSTRVSSLYLSLKIPYFLPISPPESLANSTGKLSSCAQDAKAVSGSTLIASTTTFFPPLKSLAY